MRVFLGIVLGFFLTLGAAYVADSGRHNVCPAAEGRPLVNWDEANLRWQQFTSMVETGWHKLTGQ